MTKLLQVTGLTKSFGAVQAVSNIHFAIEKGNCAALLGPNGAGKTTTIRMLTGLLKPTAGQIDIDGADGAGRVGHLIGYLPQSPAFYNWMTGLEYVIYVGKLCGLQADLAKKRAKELIDRVGLSNAAKRRIGSYSGGMKQRLGLAQALVHEPKLLVMDEPVSALDPVGRREVLALLKELKKETTVLFSTHVLHDAEELCDDVIIIRNGQIALQGSINEIRSQHRQPVIELHLEADSESELWLAGYVERIRLLPPKSGEANLFKDIQLQPGIARFSVTEIHAARQLLLEDLARERVKISRMDVAYTSLEDLFMKVVTS